MNLSLEHVCTVTHLPRGDVLAYTRDPTHSFPAAAGFYGGSPVWDREAVVNWMEDHRLEQLTESAKRKGKRVRPQPQGIHSQGVCEAMQEGNDRLSRQTVNRSVLLEPRRADIDSRKLAQRFALARLPEVPEPPEPVGLPNAESTVGSPDKRPSGQP
jgi:hypothetical protein